VIVVVMRRRVAEVGRWLAVPEAFGLARRALQRSLRKQSYGPFPAVRVGRSLFPVRPAQPSLQPFNNGLGANGSPSGLVNA
jgi:hypothetical protein